MSKLERLGFYMRYNEDDKYEEETNEMRVMEETVQYLDARFEEFYNNPVAYVNAVKAYVDREDLKTTSRKEGRQLGIAEGRKEGEIIGIEKTVKRMLIKNYDTKEISECTGLSIEEIKKIEDEMLS